jgi:hypothetical protein
MLPSRGASATSSARARASLSPPSASPSQHGSCELLSVKVGSAPIQMSIPSRATAASCARISARSAGSNYFSGSGGGGGWSPG